MRDVAVIAFAQHPNLRAHREGNDIEILIQPIADAVAESGLTREQIQFTTGGSNDFLVGRAFSFLRALDAVGIYPAKEDSHVEMDGAWALYEAWVRLQCGDIDTALVWGLGKTSLGDISELMTLSVDPYYMAPLAPEPQDLAALQLRAMLDAGICCERELAEIAAQRQASALQNPWVEWDRARSADEILTEPYTSSPLRPSLGPPTTDGAACVILAAGDVARRHCKRPAWIKGIDHRTDAHSIGVRDLTECRSAKWAAEHAGVGAAPVDVAELHASFAHEEILLRRALGLGEATVVNPSGGPLTADPMMATGLIRIGEAAARIHAGDAGRVVGHASAGLCLQNNMVVVMEAS